MITTEAEYEAARAQRAENRTNRARIAVELTASGLQPTEVEKAMQPILSFHLALEEEIFAWEIRRDREAWTTSPTAP